MRDEYFDELVFSDVSDWLDHHDEQVSILLFPPVLNKYRFRIHQLIQQSFPNLTTVSIGQEESRRTVVYPATVLDFKRPLFTPHTPLTPAMESSERPHSSGKKARPSLQAYVPPGLRNQEHRVHGVKASLSTAKRKGNALTSTKRKSIAIVPESRSEPVEVSISPYQYFRAPKPTAAHSTSSTPPHETTEEVSDAVDQRRSFVHPSAGTRHRSSRPSDGITVELAGLSLSNENGTQTPPSGYPNSFTGSIKVLRRPSSNNPDTLPEHKISNKLSESILQELTAAFGQSTTLYEPAQSYHQYAPLNFDGEDAGGYSHVLEAYDFPSTFLTEELSKDIQLITQEFFDVRWVDETHALVIFSSDGAARRACKSDLLSVKTKLRPLSEASEQGKKKARACVQSDTLSPFKHRPETSASTARRLVAGALGIKIDVPKGKREEELRQLTDAKKEKVFTAQRKDDIWEGRV